MDTRNGDWPGRPRRDEEQHGHHGQGNGGHGERHRHHDDHRDHRARHDEQNGPREQHGSHHDEQQGRHGEQHGRRDEHQGHQDDCARDGRDSIGDVLTRDPNALDMSDTLQRAAQVMADHGYDRLPVVDDHRRFVGLITGRAILGKAVARGVDTRHARVEEYVQRQTAVAHPEDNVHAVLSRMRSEGNERLVVVGRDGTLIGYVTEALLERATRR